MAESPSFVCALCGKNYTTKMILKRHISNHKDGTVFECKLCRKKYSGKQTLENHMKKVHDCPLCSETFLYRRKLTDHLANYHEAPLLFECYHCTRTFHTKVDLVRHIHSCRSNPVSEKSISNVNRFRCGICDELFPSKVCINKHFRDIHEITLEIETLLLETFDEFNEWKANTQQQSITQFVKQKSWETRTHYKMRFVCHRSSISRTHSRRKTNKLPKRTGSKKLQTYCPAEIDVSVSRIDGTCIVNYIKTHLGHSMNDPEELQHIYLTEQERLHIAVLLKEGVPRKEIQEQKSLSDKEKAGSRLSVLSSADIKNVATSYSHIINECAFSDDDICMETVFVEMVDVDDYPYREI